MRKSLILLVGILSLVLGVIGIFLPVLPTTPFALLSIYCFERSSPRFHAYCMAIPLFGQSVRDWKIHRKISIKSKMTACIFIGISIIIICLNDNINNFVQGGVVTLLILVGSFILKQKS